MSDVWFVFEINRRDRTVTLSREFAGFREKTVPWDAARLSDGRSFDDWEPADCTPVELLQPEPMNPAQWQAAAKDTG